MRPHHDRADINAGAPDENVAFQTVRDFNFSQRPRAPQLLLVNGTRAG